LCSVFSTKSFMILWCGRDSLGQMNLWTSVSMVCNILNRKNGILSNHPCRRWSNKRIFCRYITLQWPSQVMYCCTIITTSFHGVNSEVLQNHIPFFTRASPCLRNCSRILGFDLRQQYQCSPVWVSPITSTIFSSVIGTIVPITSVLISLKLMEN
jgi:hypothetical protein